MIEKEGWLTKEGGKFKSWKKRWFSLKGSLLTYSGQPGKPSELGRIHLSDVSDARAAAKKGKNFIFEIVTPYRVFVVKAENEQERSEWMDAIKKAKEELKAKSAPQASASVAVANPQEQKKIGVDDFDLLTTVGKGSFGKVLQVRKKDNGKIFAMKVLDKQHILDSNEMEHTRAEKKILQMLHHPFLVNLYYSFQTETKLYLIMDFINGGEMFFHLQKEKMFSLERVTFYGAEICLALSHLHESGIVYRDLKPENLLLTNEGHVVMTDFGLCKDGMDSTTRTGTFCGTPEYIAPEILQGKAYGKEVDWWSYGCLIYEMLCGLPPFYSQDVEEMYKKILTAKIFYPKHLTEDAKDLIAKLLEREPGTRLSNPAQIKAHPFFKSIDWQKLYDKLVTPPFIPEVKGKDDVSQIDPEFTSEKPVINDDKSVHIDPTLQDNFKGFTFVQTSQIEGGL